MIGIGIDFGTSNSAAAWFDGEKVHLIHIEPDKATIPTAIHLDQSFQTLTGSTAIQAYVEENTDRRVEITAKAIGEITLDIGKAMAGPGPDGDDGRHTIYGPAEDYGLPGRLFLGIKRLLGKEQVKRLMVFERPFRVVALITPILISIRKAIQPALNKPHQSLYVGRPVDFEGSKTGKNVLAVDRLVEACGYAQLKDVAFYPEPTAACLSFIHKQNIQHDCTILTIDFGGGTLDLSLVHFHENNFNVLGTEGVAIGGDYIDQLLFEKLIFPELGQDLPWLRTVDGRLIDTPFPFDQYEKGLLNWTITHTLNQNQFLAPIHDYLSQEQHSDEDKEKLRRLRDTIIHNYSYLIFQAIKTAKAELSENESTVIDIPELNLEIPLSQTQLNTLLQSVLDTLQTCINTLLSRCKIDGGEIDYVVRTGGSSKLVAVIDLLDQLFPNKVVQHDTFTSVASGLAIASYFQYHCDID